MIKRSQTISQNSNEKKEDSPELSQEACDDHDE
jgi:hypothetical protein